MSGRASIIAAAAVLALAAGWPISAARASVPPADLVFTPHRADGAYTPGERAGWTVTLAPGVQAVDGSFSYRITRDERAVVKTGRFDLSSGSAEIDLPPGEPGSFRVVVDYMAPPPPPPLTAAEARELNQALRKLLVAADPTLASVLAKYPHYQFVPARRFRFRDMMEQRVATLTASVAR